MVFRVGQEVGEVSVVGQQEKAVGVLVEGVNRVKKHTKAGPTASGSQAGGIVTTEAPIHVSNVQLVVEKDGNKVVTRVGYRFDDEGNKIRVAKRTGEDI